MSRPHDTAWRIAWYLLALWALAAPLLVLLAGCAASDARLAVAPTSQPVDVEQVVGQVAAALDARVAAAVTAALDTRITGIGGDGYHSEFGVGATLVVAAALILTLVLSHRREMRRLAGQGGLRIRRIDEER